MWQQNKKLLLTPESKVIIQGITEPLGSLYAAQMKAYGTNIVAGISAGHSGQFVHGIPVFDLVEQALPAVGTVDSTIIFVPPYSALDAALEAIAAGIKQIILTTIGIPPLDMVCLLRKAEATKTIVLGPGSAGIIIPGKLLLGTHESEFYTPGHIGTISRSGKPLTGEVALALTKAGLGQSIVVSLGNDAIVGASFLQWLQFLAEDKHTKAIVWVGQTGGGGEEAAAEYIAKAVDKPVVAYIAGRHTPVEKVLGDAGAIIVSQLSGPVTYSGTASRKIAAFEQAKIPVASRPSQIPDLVKKALKK